MLCHCETEEDGNCQVRKFERLAEHPLVQILFLSRRWKDDSPEGVVHEVKEWRQRRDKPCFKSE
jgi:hypothetical protein